MTPAPDYCGALEIGFGTASAMPCPGQVFVRYAAIGKTASHLYFPSLAPGTDTDNFEIRANLTLYTESPDL